MASRTCLLVQIYVCCLLYLQAVEVLSASGLGHAIKKRSTVQTCNMVNIYTGRSCIDYSDYGCFCGLGMVGQNPVDDADRCCLEHDRCFGDVSCRFYWYSYFTWYSYSCGDDSCTCTDSPVEYPCAHSVCQCDLQLAACLKNASYEINHFNYNTSLCY